MKVKFSVPTEPRPCPRPRFGRGVYMPREYREYQSQIKAAAVEAMAGQFPLLGAVKCRLTFYRQFRADSRRFGDCDNLAKAITDALNKVCYADDSQITILEIAKVQSAAAGVEIEISAVDEN